MRHGVKKFKSRYGKDADTMLLRKLAVNFISHGAMSTTEKKAKALSTYMARLVEKSKERTEANKNYLLHHFSSVEMVDRLFDKVGPVMKDVTGGYLKLKRLQQRYADGAMMVQVSWVKPVIMEEKVEVTKTKASSAKAPEAPKTPEKVKKTAKAAPSVKK